jgi:5-methylcytosine-specific restriction endonuclease McrA
MGKRQREWARNTRDILFFLLGSKCIKCNSKKDLEFDVIHPTGNSDHHRKMDWSMRMVFYKRQYENNNLQLLCSSCNNHKQNNLELFDYKSIDIPF